MLPVNQTKVSVTMSESIVQPLEHYARPSLMTGPGKYAARLAIRVGDNDKETFERTHNPQAHE